MKSKKEEREILIRILKNTQEILDLLKGNPVERVNVDDLLNEYLFGGDKK